MSDDLSHNDRFGWDGSAAPTPPTADDLHGAQVVIVGVPVSSPDPVPPEVPQMSDVKVISPTVGRVVWFHEGAAGMFPGSDDTRAAIVAHVWNDRMVNLAVFDANGNTHSRTSVPLLQPGDAIPTSGFYAEWMPYQIGQAAKHAAG